MDIIESITQGLHNLAGAFQPSVNKGNIQGVVSPIPEKNIVSRPVPSAYEQALKNINNGANQVGNTLYDIGQIPHNIQVGVNNFNQGVQKGIQSGVNNANQWGQAFHITGQNPAQNTPRAVKGASTYNAPTPTPTTHWYTAQEAGADPVTPAPQLTPLEQPTIPIFKQYGIHPAVAFGIAQAEGGRIGSHNVWNINATDSNPNGAYNYDSVSSAAASAARTMQALLQKSGYTGADPRGQILAIEKAGYAGDPATWQHRSAMQGGAGKNFRHWSDFVFSTDAYKKWANQQGQ